MSTQLTAPPLERRFNVMPDERRITEWRQPYVSLRQHATGAVFGYETRARHAIAPAGSLSAESLFEHRLRFERADGVAEIHCRIRVTGEMERFRIDGQLTASWNGAVLVERRWTPGPPRRMS